MAKHLKVKVTYAAAAEPFKENDVPDAETLGVLKPTVLNFFGVKEGEQGGETITYVFFHGKVRLTDLSVKLGTLAGGAEELHLKLSQHIEQGFA